MSHTAENVKILDHRDLNPPDSALVQPSEDSSNLGSAVQALLQGVTEAAVRDVRATFNAPAAEALATRNALFTPEIEEVLQKQAAELSQRTSLEVAQAPVVAQTAPETVPAGPELPDGYEFASVYTDLIISASRNLRSTPEIADNREGSVSSGMLHAIEVTSVNDGAYRWFYVPESKLFVAVERSGTDSVQIETTTLPVTPEAVATPETPVGEPTEMPPQAGTDEPPAGPDLPQGPALAPTEAPNTPDHLGGNTIVREFTLSEMLAMDESVRPLPEYAFLHPEEDEWPVVNQLPTHVFNLQNGNAQPVAVNNPTFIQFSNGEVHMMVPGFAGGSIVWIEHSGWAVEQPISSLTARVFLDTGYPFLHNRRKFSGARQEATYGIVPFELQNLSSSDRLVYAGQDFSSIFVQIFKTPTPNPLLEINNSTSAEVNISPLDAQVITAFAFLEKNGQPSDADILDTWRRFSQSNEEMIVETPVGIWNLRSGLNLVFGPLAELDNRDSAPVTTFGSKYVDIDNNGRITILHTGRSVDSWNATITLGVAFRKLLGMGDPTNEQESAIDRAAILLTQEGHLELQMVPLVGRDEVGGAIHPLMR